MSKYFHNPSTLVLALSLAFPGLLCAQDGPLNVEPLPEAPPEEIATVIRDSLETKAVRVLDGQGEPLADVWLRQGVPARGKPAGSEGAVLFPVLEVGQLIGIVRFQEESYDYRDQPIAPGLYTLRYGLQPINGDHLGVSTYRDYVMLVPAQDETDLETIEQETLDVISADAAMTNHPAVYLLDAAPEGIEAPAPVHNQEKQRWGVVLPVSIQVAGEEELSTLRVQLILVGHGPV